MMELDDAGGDSDSDDTQHDASTVVGLVALERFADALAMRGAEQVRQPPPWHHYRYNHRRSRPGNGAVCVDQVGHSGCEASQDGSD